MKSWKEVAERIVAGLQQPDGTSANDIARQRLSRMATICDYHLMLESDGSEENVSAVLPAEPEVIDTDGGLSDWAT